MHRGDVSRIKINPGSSDQLFCLEILLKMDLLVGSVGRNGQFVATPGEGRDRPFVSHMAVTCAAT